MSAPRMQYKERGFSLVELLIVVVILTILAAIVVPQFSSATTDAQDSALDSNLNAIRSAIELYKIQHGNTYPGVKISSGATCPNSSTAGTGNTAGSSQAFIDQLAMFSDADGRTCAQGDATFRYGPYLRKGVPGDPVTGKGTVSGEITYTGTGSAITASGTGGWAFDGKSGEFIMNHTGTDGKGKAYSTH